MNKVPCKEVKENAESNDSVVAVLSNLIKLHFMKEFVLTHSPFINKSNAVDKDWDILFNSKYFSYFMF